MLSLSHHIRETCGPSSTSLLIENNHTNLLNPLDMWLATDLVIMLDASNLFLWLTRLSI